MELRKLGRYNLSEYIKDKFGGSEIPFCIKDRDDHRGRVIDISLKGFGIEIPGEKEDFITFVKNQEVFIVQIILLEETIEVRAKKMWFELFQVEEKNIYRGGLIFEEISPEDRLIISNFVDKMRSNSD